VRISRSKRWVRVEITVGMRAIARDACVREQAQSRLEQQSAKMSRRLQQADESFKSEARNGIESRAGRVVQRTNGRSADCWRDSHDRGVARPEAGESATATRR
jgi:hypothetical protein